MKKQTQQHIYFIQSGLDGPIKIGISNNPKKRMRELQHSCPFELRMVGIIKNGGKEWEDKLHRKFAHSRMKGEWYKPTQTLLQCIQQSNNPKLITEMQKEIDKQNKSTKELTMKMLSKWESNIQKDISNGTPIDEVKKKWHIGNKYLNQLIDSTVLIQPKKPKPRRNRQPNFSQREEIKFMRMLGETTWQSRHK